MTEQELMAISGYRTTFHDMFAADSGPAPRVSAIEIPLIQRDYAQGREDARAEAIRGNFLESLHGALTGDTAAGLDFIYGEVRDDGTFEPLDGQQRLTTLFLLHWYVAARRGDLGSDHDWTRFSYATRPSARRFCERVVENPPPVHELAVPSAWIRDQSWHLHLWSYDPSISAMLVTLDAIAARFADEDAEVLWNRLTDQNDPAIWFQLLPIDEMGAAEDLYIKMNSRGKPLTEFEAFKALLGQLVDEVGGYEDFGHRIDGAWTDLLWPYRGDNDIVDDEFMRYFDFLMEVCEWREARGGSGSRPSTADRRVRALLQPTNPHRHQHLEFIHQAFDGWVGIESSIADTFDQLFTIKPDGRRVRLFGASATSNLLVACCERYGDVSGTTRLFSLTDTLLLFAVLVGRHLDTEELRSRLRVLRNVNEASQFELRVSNMPKLTGEVEAFMVSGDLDRLVTFNSNQVDEECVKRDLLAAHPAMREAGIQLEDHPLLRGTLASFDLDDTLIARSTAFEAVFEPELWHLVTGALLAAGEYQRGYASSDQFRLGSPTTDSVWRLVLVDRGDRGSLEPVRTTLSRLLDRVGTASTDVRETLERVSADFTAEREAAGWFDWRYYLVAYSEMREGNSGIYYGADRRLGYEMTMLRRKVQSSYFRDPYLYAMWSRAGRPPEVDDPWFYGYSTTPRWMTLTASRIRLRSEQEGVAIELPVGSSAAATFDDLVMSDGFLETDGGWLLPVPQRLEGGVPLDTEDRIMLGATLLQRLVAAGY